MTTDILFDKGSEYLAKTNLSANLSYEVGLYNDSTNPLGPNSDPILSGDIGGEPDSTDSYSRQSFVTSIEDFGSEWGLDNGADITFDTSTNTEIIDAVFLVATFQAAGDGAPTEHIILNASITQTNLSGTDQLTIEAGNGASGIGFAIQ